MDIETITKLIDAGYTKAEIDSMQAGDVGSGEADKGAGASDQNAGEAQSATNTENAREINNPVDFGAAIEALTNTVNGLANTVKAMQAANVKTAGTDSPHGTDKIKEAMDSFINTL